MKGDDPFEGFSRVLFEAREQTWIGTTGRIATNAIDVPKHLITE